ncbi:MAG: hypothetical protein GF344_12485 [Chitinivibrionales bacterium]|nr:hypothetical protein [Chitinivibrionales bacterium]MBD3357573.1 hypothetical protein [Chitinivibrionales bacterium]
MSAHRLLDPILNQGIRHTNFFEGRLLTGEDLRNQQEAHREHDRRLGRAIGSGIVEGLEVDLLHDGSDGESPTVRVTKGLAINGLGEIVGLPHSDVILALSRTIDPPQVEPADFYACAAPPGFQQLPSGAGVYVLAMSPVAAYKGRAPKSGLGDNGIAKGCGGKYVREGVRFRLVEFTPWEGSDVSPELHDQFRDLMDTLETDTSAGDSMLRNLLGYRCLYPRALRGVPDDPFDPFSTNLPGNRIDNGGSFICAGLDECDTPLALLFWTVTGVRFVDVWAVRRLTFGPQGGRCGLVPGPALSVADAMVHQFQAHVADLLSRHRNPELVRLDEHFRFLPPAGIIPLALSPGPIGFSQEKFFEEIVHRELAFITAPQLRALFAESGAYPPIDVNAKELVWIYFVRENAWTANTVGPRRVYAVFTSGHMPYYGNARFELGWWDHANFGKI